MLLNNLLGEIVCIKFPGNKQKGEFIYDILPLIYFINATNDFFFFKFNLITIAGNIDQLRFQSVLKKVFLRLYPLCLTVILP